MKLDPKRVQKGFFVAKRRMGTSALEMTVFLLFILIRNSG